MLAVLVKCIGVASGIVALAALTVAVSLIAGVQAAAYGDFDWGVAAGVATATGTVLLAMTGALAWTTYRDVAGTWQQVELQREDMEARGRPRVVLSR